MLNRHDSSKSYDKSELAFKHTVLGLGQTPNIVPLAKPKFKEKPRPVEVGWHPVGGAVGKWFAEDTGLGKMITEKTNKYPDPTQHWAVLVGDYAHQLWMVSAPASIAGGSISYRIARVPLCVSLCVSEWLTWNLFKDEEFHVIYINEKVKREEWRTFPVGETRFNDDAVRRAGASLPTLQLSSAFLPGIVDQ
jgi:hypothetical protein